jgi:tripartite-type tricarboxylate transporter receptor subunit TctC
MRNAPAFCATTRGRCIAWPSGSPAVTLARRHFLQVAAGAAALPMLPATWPGTARADTYPSRPVRMIIGFPPGGTTDIAARLIGQWLSDHLGQAFVVESRPGAATNLATEAVVRSAPDGYTLLVSVGSNTINPSLYDNLNFDFIRDMAMAAGILRTAMVLEVNPALPVHSVPELIAYAKANPGKVTLASFGTGSISHIAGELFKMTTGTDMVHVPYRGSGPMVPNLVGGQVQAAFDNLPTSVEFIKTGKLRALAVTSQMRQPLLPDVPTMAEFLPGFEITSWGGICGPAGLPPAMVEKCARPSPGRRSRAMP